MDTSVLQCCPLFVGLDDGGISFALEFFGADERAYAKGETLNRAGDPFRRFGLVLSGNVQVLSDDYYGGQMLMQSVTAGQTFGESICFLGIVTDVYTVAALASRVLWLDPGRVRTARSEPERELANRFCEMIARRALQKNSHVQILSKLTLRAKLVTLFSQYACGREEFEIPFDRAALAVYLGTNRTALSRELSRMREEGMIEFSKNRFRMKKDFF